MTVAICLSTSAFDNANVLLTHLCTNCGLDKHKMGKDLWTKLKVYKAGSSHILAREKKDLGMSSVEGGKTLTVYDVPPPCVDPLREPEAQTHIRSHLPCA